MTDIALNKPEADPISLASLMELLSGLDSDAVLYSDAYYGPGSIGGSYFPKLEARIFEVDEFSFHSEISREPMTVGEFLTFLRGAVPSLLNDGHSVTMDCHVWMSFGRFGIAVVNEGLVSGVGMNSDGSYALQRTKTDFINEARKRHLIQW